MATNVAVEGVELGIFSGDFRIERIVVQDVPGFDGGPTLILKDVGWSLPLTALSEPEFTIEEVTLAEVEFRLEMSEETVNFFVLLQNMRERMENEPESSQVSTHVEGQAPKRYRIGKVGIQSIEVQLGENMKTPGPKEAGPTPIPPAELELVDGWYTFDEVIEQLLLALAKSLDKGTVYLDLNETASMSLSKAFEALPPPLTSEESSAEAPPSGDSDDAE